MGKLKNEKAPGKNEVTKEVTDGVDRVVDFFWRVCNKTFESGVMLKDRRSSVIVSLYKGKGESTESSNYRGISLSSVVKKTYAGILVDRV